MIIRSLPINISLYIKNLLKNHINAINCLAGNY